MGEVNIVVSDGFDSVDAAGFDLILSNPPYQTDFAVANFQALQYLADHGARGALVGLDQIVTLVKDGQVEFPAQFDGYLSVFCMGADAKGVKIRGLHYETENAVLTAGFPLGVSNRFVGKKAEISVEEGSLLLIWERKNGLVR